MSIESLDTENDVICEKVNEAGIRLDVYAAQVLERETGGTRSMAKKLIDSGMVLLNGKPGKANVKTHIGDSISITLPKPHDADAKPENIPIDIVYEDESIAVINKEKGMVVHPAPGNDSGTLVNALMYRIKDLSGIGGVIRPGIVHRIDKMTSGLLVVAKNDSAHLSLSAQIKEHSAKRTYIALVTGNIKEESGTVDIAIGRHGTDRKKMAVQTKNASGVFRNAVTHYRVLERFGQYTLIEAKLETGRTHQIRVHMAYIKHPVLGDTLYGSGKNPFSLDGQALHAVNLELTHPQTGERMKFYAPLPQYFTEILKRLGSKFDFSEYARDNSNNKTE